MARNAGHFPHLLTIDLRDETGWLGREDSNLRMAGVSLPCYGSIASLLLE
jgi:hypothetical protein